MMSRGGSCVVDVINGRLLRGQWEVLARSSCRRKECDYIASSVRTNQQDPHAVLITHRIWEAGSAEKTVEILATITTNTSPWSEWTRRVFVANLFRTSGRWLRGEASVDRFGFALVEAPVGTKFRKRWARQVLGDSDHELLNNATVARRPFTVHDLREDMATSIPEQGADPTHVDSVRAVARLVSQVVGRSASSDSAGAASSFSESEELLEQTSFPSVRALVRALLSIIRHVLEYRKRHRLGEFSANSADENGRSLSAHIGSILENSAGLWTKLAQAVCVEVVRAFEGLVLKTRGATSGGPGETGSCEEGGGVFPADMTKDDLYTLLLPFVSDPNHFGPTTALATAADRVALLCAQFCQYWSPRLGSGETRSGGPRSAFCKAFDTAPSANDPKQTVCRLFGRIRGLTGGAPFPERVSTLPRVLPPTEQYGIKNAERTRAVEAQIDVVAWPW